MPPVCDINLRGYRVLRSESNHQVLVHLELESQPDRCRCCGSPRLVGKGRYRRRARHLNSFGLPSLLHIETRRLECRDCGRSFLPETPGLRPWKRSTEPWRQKVYSQHQEGICASALGRLMKLGGASVEGIYAEFTSRKARERLSLQCPQVLGIDEHTLHKGQRLATTFCDLKNRRVFDIVAGRSPRELRSFLAALQGREKVRVVCIDLSSPYRSLIASHFPRAKIVADRFHVIRIVTQHFLELARQIAPSIKNHRGSLVVLRKRRTTSRLAAAYVSKRSLPNTLLSSPSMRPCSDCALSSISSIKQNVLVGLLLATPWIY
jgi:transposase